MLMIWLLERKWGWDYDEVISCVVRAPTGLDARRVAKRQHREFGDPKRSSCRRVREDGKAQTILAYVRHG